jgi:uncharacterized protein YyaL (SSP411 family)
MADSNKLINETSPYLLQHAHNPVDWYPWGEDALQRAIREDKPILVSIGYAACHWCHVMERESFEDAATAQIMNAHFVCIKIDREERPDLDHFFMDALQAISGQGGWPLNMFLTSDARPFYGGTYFPPIRLHNRISWKELLLQIHQAYQERRTEILEQAANLVRYLGDANQKLTVSIPNMGLNPEDRWTPEQAGKVFQQIMQSADTLEGGFGQAPKFPQTYSIQYLLRYHLYHGESTALDQALLSLRKMMRGGIYDQAGGGFCRYSTDNEWLAPHFEKMTYDNALILQVMAEAYQMTSDSELNRVAEQTVEFMVREMKSAEGGFYAALDADSEGVEGKFYTWTEDEFNTVLGADANRFASLFDISSTGNWEKVNILRMKRSLEDWAKEHGIEMGEAIAQSTAARTKLLKARETRVRPGTDDKIILGWNALFNQALSKGAIAFGQPVWLELASENMDFMLTRFVDPHTGAWLHTHKNGISRYPAFLDDLAYLVQALVYLYEPTGKLSLLQKAKEIMEHVLTDFTDEAGLFFYYTPASHADVPVRKKEIYDGATPSSNAVMAWNLYRLGILLGKNDWKQRAFAMLEGLHENVLRYPTSFGIWANLLLEISRGTEEILVLGEGAVEALQQILRHPIPNHVAMASEKSSEGYPLMQGRQPLQGSLLFYACRNYSCGMPERDLGLFVNAILTKR